MKALIIDDEARARRLLTIMLKDYCPKITETKEAKNLMDGIETIRRYEPAIVFLDVEMPGFLGIEIGDFLTEEEMNFHLIFTTAYSDYAIKAFEVNAIYYLLKPIRPAHLKLAVEKVVKKELAKNTPAQIQGLNNELTEGPKRLSIPVKDGILYIKLEEIICIVADGSYAELYVQNEKVKLVSKPLKYFVEILEDNQAFYRPHRSSIINLKFVKQYVKKDGHSILMDNGVQVAVARNKKGELLEMLEQL